MAFNSFRDKTVCSSCMLMDSQNVPSSRDSTLPTCRNVAQPDMSSLIAEVFQQFYSKLVKTLPMNDAVFIVKLFSNNLLPGDLKNQLKLLHRTSADKAALFLDSVMEPSVTSDFGSSFDKLLNVMEESEYQHVKELAKHIRMNTLKKISTTDSGM